ncbi:hypothetical protein N9Y60_03270 [Crocinitomicaceae bacterium]|nr:hypothetical protein [Crocinitomicaceae bacterium]
MKQLYLLLGSLFAFNFSFSQVDQSDWDTASVIQLGNGYSRIVLESPEDTTSNIYYFNGQLESIRPVTSGTYNRYYQDGTLMWSQEIDNGKVNGEMKLFDPKGKHVGTFGFKNDTLVDTLFLHRSKSFVFGRFTYSSVMHGGMMRPDGTSNISRSNGGKMLTSMYAVKHSKSEAATKYSEFTTDANGYFFFMAEQGSFGIFPNYQNIENVTSDMGAPLGRRGSSVDINWNVTGPIKISRNFCYLSLHVNSTGYAP